MAEGILPIINGHEFSVLRRRTFGDDNNRVARARRIACDACRIVQAFFQVLINSLVAKWMLRNQNEVGLPGHSRPQRQMPGVASHDFDDLYPTVRACGRARALDDLRDVAQRRVEAERVIRSRQILIYRLRHANDTHAFLS